MVGFLYGAQLLGGVVRLVGYQPFLRSAPELVVGAFLVFVFSAVGFVITFLAVRVLIWLPSPLLPGIGRKNAYDRATERFRMSPQAWARVRGGTAQVP